MQSTFGRLLRSSSSSLSTSSTSSSSLARTLRKRPPGPIPHPYPQPPPLPPVPPTTRLGVPLQQVFPGVEQPSLQLPPVDERATTRQTTLDSGLRVVSEETYAPVSSVGVFFQGGTRFQSDASAGVCHAWERCAVRPTPTSTMLQTIERLDALGGALLAQNSREVVGIVAESVRPGLGGLVAIVGEQLANDTFDDETLEHTRAAMHLDIKATTENTYMFLVEALHEIAYAGAPLGYSLYASPERIDTLTPADVRAHVRQHLTLGNTIVAGIGADHDALVELVRAHIEPHIFAGAQPIVARPSPYVGGYQLIEEPAHLVPVDAVQANQQPLAAHFMLAFEGPSFSAHDFHALAVLSQLMGGGGSFSSGGPGKGMYSRLYREVVNKHYWIQACQASASAYADSSLFIVYGACNAAQLAQLTQVVSLELANMCGGFGDEEVARAKNQLKAQVFMALEANAVLLEDLKQVHVYGQRLPAAVHAALIDEVSADDLQRVATMLLRSPATVVAYGQPEQLQHVPAHSEFAEFFARASGADNRAAGERNVWLPRKLDQYLKK